MAQRTVLRLVDDVDGTEIDNTVGATIRFALDGKPYEIDLNPSNAETLRTALKPFVEAGRRTGRSPRN